jgi:hypothetical protein
MRAAAVQRPPPGRIGEPHCRLAVGAVRVDAALGHNAQMLHVQEYAGALEALPRAAPVAQAILEQAPRSVARWKGEGVSRYGCCDFRIDGSADFQEGEHG